MDLTLPQPALHRALSRAARFVPSRTPLPILGAVLLEADGGGLTLTAGDEERAVRLSLAAEVATPGRSALPARLLHEVVAQLPAEQVRLTLDGEGRRVQVRCARCTARLAVLEVQDFPALPPPGQAWAFDLDAGRLARAIEQVAFATTKDATRPVLAAVQFDFRPDGLTLAAADGFRLATVRLPEAGAASRQLLVPGRALTEFRRLLEDESAARLALTPDEQGLVLITGMTQGFTRLLEGRFPDLSRVIPSAWRTRVVVEAASFRQTVRMAGRFGADGDARPVLVEAQPGCLHLGARRADGDEAHGQVPATVEGEAQGIALNTRLLDEVLEGADRPELELT